MNEKNLAPLLLLRAELYRFLADSTLRGPSERAQGKLLRAVSESPAFREAYPAAVPFVKKLIQALASVSLREYSALFEGTQGTPFPLWESAWTGCGGILLDETTLRVKRFYKRFGVGVRDTGQPCDHIGLECGFLSFLAGSLAEAAARGSERVFPQLADGQREFLSAHLRPFSASFCTGLSERAAAGYYRTFSAFLEAFVARDLELSADFHVPDAAFPAPPAAPPPDFRKLGETERADEPISVVRTSGRNNCGGKCIIYAHVQEGSVLKLSTECGAPAGDEEILSACVRGRAYRKTFLNTGRLRYPMQRIGERGQGRFERITWGQAVELIAEKLKAVKEKYGPASRYVNYATGISAVAAGDALAMRLLALDGGYLGRYNSYSSACASIATPYTYGTNLTGSSSSELIHAKLILLWGHNPLETIFGTSTPAELLKAKRAGVRIIAVDPRLSDTAACADEWIGLRPTTDSALMDAMAYVILSEHLQDQAFMDRYCIGFDRAHMPPGAQDEETYLDYVSGRRDGVPKTPEWAERITGVGRETIIRLAREYASSKPAALIQGLGPQRNGNGEQTVRSATMLACLTGNVGIPGGSAAGCARVPGHREPCIRIPENPAHVRIPSFLWTDAIVRGPEMTAKDDGVLGTERLPAPIKLILNLAGNTLINQHSDINRTARILRDPSLCEFIVCSDLFLTPSARFADVLLPGTSFFEGPNITLPWERGDYILYNNPAVPPLFESRFEYDWLAEVAEKLGLRESFTQGCESLTEHLKAVYEETRKAEAELPPFAEFTRAGVYKYKHRKEFIAFREQIEDPEHHPFPTPSGKIEIYSQRLHDLGNPAEIPAIPKYVPSFEGPDDPARKEYPLQLIGWHTKRRCHSTHDNNDWLAAVERQEVWIHPADAAARSIHEGNLVEIWNSRGRIRIPAHVTERIVKGVVAVSQGAWYRPDASGTDTGGSINVLTTSRPTPLAKGNPQHSNLVEMRPVPPAPQETRQTMER